MAAELRNAANSGRVVPSPLAASTIPGSWGRRSSLRYAGFGVLILATAVVALNWPRSPALPPAAALTPTGIDIADSLATTIEDTGPAPAATALPEAQSTASPTESNPLKERSISATTSSTRLSLAIRPWGVVYVNGKKKGLSPPLKEIVLAPGTYPVEIRNDKFQPYRERIELRNGMPAKITYRFSDTFEGPAKDTEAETTCDCVENTHVERRVATIGGLTALERTDLHVSMSFEQKSADLVQRQNPSH